MAKVSKKKDNQIEIKKITRQIIEKYKPEKIILFGSFAWGKPNKDSDFDILIIKETRKSHYRRIPEVRSYLHDVNRAMDILVMTPKELARRIQLGDFFIKNILQKGKILYERSI